MNHTGNARCATPRRLATAARTAGLALAAPLVLAACGGGGGPDAQGVSTAPVAIQGALTKGPVSGATIRAFELSPSGTAADSAAVGVTTTDAAGNFTFAQRPGIGPLLLVSSGGSYVDESDPNPVLADKRQISLGPDDGLSAVLPDGENRIALTPLSQMIYDRARLTASEAPFLGVFAAYRQQVTAALGFDPIRDIPADPTNPAAGSSDSTLQYALALGGFANYMNAVAVALDRQPDAALLAILAEDLSDGVLNGAYLDDPLTLDSAAVPVFGLNNQIERFRNNNFERYQDTALLVVDLAALAAPIDVQNTPPVAVNDSFSVDEAAVLSIAAPGLLANDSDLDPGTQLRVSLPANGSAAGDSGDSLDTEHGSVDLSADGGFIYTHDGSEDASDSFTYILSDGVASDTATVTITVNPVNDPPALLNNQGMNASENGEPVVIGPGNLLAADPDTPDTDIRFTLRAGPAAGRLLLDLGGANPSELSVGSSFSNQDLLDEIVLYAYTGNGAPDSDSFDFSLDDGIAPPSTASFSITIADDGTNQGPVANDDLGLRMLEDDPQTAFDVLANDTDPDDDPLVVTSLFGDDPISGVAAVSADGTMVLFEPANNFFGTVDFSYTVEDAAGNTATADARITVEPVNDPPTVQINEGLTVPEGTQDAEIGNNLLRLADIDNPDPADISLTIQSIDPAGQLAVDRDGRRTLLTAGDTFTAADIDARALRFSHDGSEPDGPVNIALLPSNNGDGVGERFTFAVTILAGNDAPVAADDEVETDEDVAVTFGVAGNDVDDDGDLNEDSITIVSNVSSGTLELLSADTLRYAPDTDFLGQDSFTYTIDDFSGGTSNQATVTITVNPVNDAPTLVNNQVLSASENGDLAVIESDNLLAADPDTADENLAFTLRSGPSTGSLFLDFGEGGRTELGTGDSFSNQNVLDGIVLYGYGGEGAPDSDSFEFSLSDGIAEPVIATFDITIIDDGNNQAPIANDDLDLSMLEDGGQTEFDVLANDMDPDSDPLIITEFFSNDELPGVVEISQDGTLLFFEPADDFFGPVDFSYAIEDTAGNVATADVRITVQAVNDPPTVQINEGLTINEGDEDTVIGSDRLQFNDVDNPDPKDITLSLEAIGAAGQLIIDRNETRTILAIGDAFPAADIDEGAVRFTHDGSQPDGPINIVLEPSNDGDAVGENVTFVVTVNPVNDAPVAADDAYGNNAPSQRTDNASRDIQPAWDTRPGSELIVFRTNRAPATQSENLGVTSADGSTSEDNLLIGPDSPFGVSAGEMSWVGGTANVVLNNAQGQHSYREFNVDTRAERNVLTIPGGGGGGWMAVSRDGSTALWRYSDAGGGGNTQIRVAPYASLNGQAANAVGTQVLTAFSASGQPQPFVEAFALTPDGSRFVSSEPSGGGSDLFLRSSTDGGLIRQLTTSGQALGLQNRVPDVSPDGSRVVYANLAESATAYELFSVSIDGGEPVALTQTADVSEFDPSWSPSGDRLAFRRLDTQANGGHDGAVADNFNIWVTRATPAANGAPLQQGGTLQVPAPGVLFNDSDEEGDPLTAVLVDMPASGTVTLGPDGAFTYAHDGSGAVADSFTYRASDGVTSSNLATVELTILAGGGGDDNVEIISVADDGTQSGLDSNSPAVSADGQRVAFVSGEQALYGPPDADYNADAPRDQVYLRDRTSGTTTLISRVDNGEGIKFPANADAALPCISDDGQIIVFSTTATNFGVTDGSRQTYLVNLSLGQDDAVNPQLISTDRFGSVFDATAGSCDISADNRFVAFAADAGFTESLPSEIAGQFHIFLYDIVNQEIDLITVEQGDFGTVEANYCGAQGCYQPSLNANATAATYTSGSFGPNATDVLFHREESDPVVLTTGFNGYASAPSMDAAATRVAFEGAGPGETQVDIWVADLTANPVTFTRVNTDSNGNAPLDSNIPFGSGAVVDRIGDPQIAGNGRVVVFSAAQNGIDGPDSDNQSAYLKVLPEMLPDGDLASPAVRINAAPDGSVYTTDSNPAVRPRTDFNGEFVFFASEADNAHSNNLNGNTQDVLLRGNPFFDAGQTGALDTDGDGLSFTTENALGTNPALFDTDGDGLSDSEETGRDGNPENLLVENGGDTNPNNPDTDSDDVGDAVEILLSANPHVANVAYYVSNDRGSDSNLGNAWDSAFQTLDRAVTQSESDGTKAQPDAASSTFFLIESSELSYGTLSLNDVAAGSGSVQRTHNVFLGSTGPGVFLPRPFKDPGADLVGPGLSATSRLSPLSTSSEPVLELRGVSDITLLGLQIVGGNADFGAGLNVIQSSALLKFSSILGNSASRRGGGIRVGTGAMLAVEDTTIIGNRVESLGTPAQGGGIGVDGGGILTLAHSRVSSNQAIGFSSASSAFGGGIWAGTGALITVDNAIIAGNEARSIDDATGGGGIYLGGAGDTLIRSSQLLSNQTNGPGGGVYAQSVTGTLEIENNLVAGNLSGGEFASFILEPLGGGLYLTEFNGETTNDTGTLVLRNNTISYNQTDHIEGGSQSRAGGLAVETAGPDTLRYNIVWFNDDEDAQSTAPGEEADLAVDAATDIADNSIDEPGVPNDLGVAPDFVNGYYLGQDSSPLIDGGSELASTVGLGAPFTTSNDGAPDIGNVDLGYHHQAAGAPRAGGVTPNSFDVTCNDNDRSIRFRLSGRQAGSGHLVLLDLGPDPTANPGELRSLTSLQPATGSGNPSLLAADDGIGQYRVQYTGDQETDGVISADVVVDDLGVIDTITLNVNCFRPDD